MIINPFFYSYLGDITPYFASVPQATRVSHNSIAIAGSLSKAGNVYVYTVADGASVPSIATIKASGVSALNVGYFNISITSLTANTAYDVYTICEDLTQTTQSSPIKVDITTPLDLNSFLGSNLKFWVNTKTRTNKTLTGTFSESLDGLTSDETTSPLAFTTTTALAGGSIKHSGRGFVFLSNASQHGASKSKLNGLHTGAAFTFFARYMPIVGSTAAVTPLINNNNGSTGKIGFALFYDNRTGSGNTDALVFSVTKGSAGNSLFSITIQNFFTSGVFTTASIKYNGSGTLTIYKNGVSQGTYSPTNTPFSAADASDDIYIGKLSTTATYASSGILKDIVLTDNALSDGDRNSVEASLALGGETIGATGKANVYMMHGQSNMAGAGAGATSPPVYLQSAMKVQLWSRTDANNAINGSQAFVPLQWGVSQNTESLTCYGPELEFGYRMSTLQPDIAFLFKYAVGGTPLYVSASNDWNSTSASTDCAGQSRSQILNGYRYIRYGLDRDVDVRGWLWRQGESDANPGNATYKTDLYSTFNIFVDAFVGEGYTPVKGRGVISLIDNAFTSPSRPFTSAIVADQQAFASDYFTDNPTYVGKWSSHTTFSTSSYVLADGTHFDDNGQVAQGLAFYDYFKFHINE